MRFPLDVCIRGDGITGCALALALAAQGLRVGVVSARADEKAPGIGSGDVRAYSLNASARQLLEGLQAWPSDAHATPVRHMSVWGDEGGHIDFDAPAATALSWIVDVSALEAALHQRVQSTAEISWLHAAETAELTVVCEGRDSATRREWGLTFERQPYEQHALGFRIRHDMAHQHRARQWFSGSGSSASILAFLPLGDPHTSAVVWSLPAQRAQTLRAQTDSDLLLALSSACGATLGEMELVSERATWPLQSAQAHHWTGALSDGRAFALVGDAAHNIHPLAGLGLNLGLDDVAALSLMLSRRAAKAQLAGVADLRLLRAYERQRKLAVSTVNAACDGLQTLFAHPSPVVRWLRNTGLSCVNRMQAVKHWTMAQATHLEITP